MTDKAINAIATDTDGPPVAVTIEDDSRDYDPRSAAVVRVYYAVETVLELSHQVTDDVDDPNEDDPISEETVQALRAAQEACERAQDHPDWEAFLSDPSEMADAVLRELATALGPVAPVFGIELDLPVDVDDAGDSDRMDSDAITSVAETIATLRGRRSS